MVDDPDSSPRADEARMIDALRQVGRFMREVTDRQRLLTLIMRETERIMDSEASACMLYDEETDDLFFEVALGERADRVRSIRVRRGVGFAGICLDENRTLLSNDAQNDARRFADADKQSDFVTRNVIAVPMTYQDRLVGVLEVLNKRGGADYTEQDAQVLEVVAGQAAVAIENARLVAESLRQAELAAIGLAVSSIAHHLKNVIMSVKGPLGLIQMARERGKPELIETAAPILARGVVRMEESVRQMLSVSKSREPDLEPGHINALVEEIVEESRSRAADRGVEIVLESDPSVPPSLIDRLQLHDAILNIVGNAVEAQPENAPEPRVVVRTRLVESGGAVEVEIADNGPGIPEPLHERIFQSFFSTKGSRGTGLGLAVARKVAEENGGSLSLVSKPGRGAIFTFQLPLVMDKSREGGNDEQ